MGGRRKPGRLTKDEVFAFLGECAAQGRRCPENETEGLSGHNMPALCRDGKIRVEISGQNFRQVHILVGPHAGKSTAPNPNSKLKPWKVMGTETVLVTKPKPAAKQRPMPIRGDTARGVPSAPGFLPADYFKGD